ncbi:uncharacterized protein DS421_11g341520 [Arachis hypogaea]|nr:uncharacterized protein DS421_11g341520 [Arachis hypogaea]
MNKTGGKTTGKGGMVRQTGSSKLTNNGGIQPTALRSASPHDEDENDVEKTRMDGQR